MSLTPSVEITDGTDLPEEDFSGQILAHPDLHLALPNGSTATLSKIHNNVTTAAYEAIGTYKLASHPHSFEDLGDGQYRIFGLHDIHVDATGKIIASEEALRLLHFTLKSPGGSEVFGYEEMTRRFDFLINVVSRHVDRDALQKTYARIGAQRGYGEVPPLDLIIPTTCRKVLSRALVRKLSIQNSILAGQMLKIVDREKLRMAQLFLGWKVNVRGYNMIVDLWEITHPVTGRKQTLADLARTHLPAIVAIGFPYRNGGMSRNGGMCSASKLHAAIETFPETVAQRGHGRGLWKMLLKMSYPQLQNLMRFSAEFFADPKLTAMLVQAEAAKLPASSITPIFFATKTMAGVPGFKIDRFFRTICGQAHLARKRGRLKEFNLQLPQVVDMLSRSDRQIPGDLSWNNLVQLSNDWHEWMASRHSRKSTSWEWPALLGDKASLANSADMTATELLNTAELMHEGQMMHHCVGSYDTAAGRGECRIFHLESNKGDKATLEMRNRNGQWASFQLRSVCNSEPTAALKRLAGKLVRLANSDGAYPANAVPAGTNSRASKDVVDLTNPLSRYPERREHTDPEFGKDWDFDTVDNFDLDLAA